MSISLKQQLIALVGLIFITTSNACFAEILFLGDSYTVGEGIPDSDSWPAQLLRQRAEAGHQLSSGNLIAATGWTTADLADALQRHSPVGQRDAVTLMIGVNDQFQGISLQRFSQGLERLIDRAIALTAQQNPARVLLISIPDYSVTPFGRHFQPNRTARELTEFNAIIQNRAKARGLRFVNVTDISQRADTDLTLLAIDRLHPSAKMYSLWLQRILPAIDEILETP